MFQFGSLEVKYFWIYFCIFRNRKFDVKYLVFHQNNDFFWYFYAHVTDNFLVLLQFWYTSLNWLLCILRNFNFQFWFILHIKYLVMVLRLGRSSWWIWLFFPWHRLFFILCTNTNHASMSSVKTVEMTFLPSSLCLLGKEWKPSPFPKLYSPLSRPIKISRYFS